MWLLKSVSTSLKRSQNTSNLHLLYKKKVPIFIVTSTNEKLLHVVVSFAFTFLLFFYFEVELLLFNLMNTPHCLLSMTGVSAPYI